MNQKETVTGLEGNDHASRTLERVEQTPPFVMERVSKLKECDRSFDYEFWQKQTYTERISASWDLVRHYHITVKGEDEDILRLQRSVESVRRK